VLAFAVRQLRARGGRLVLANPSSTVRKVLDISGLASATEVMEPGRDHHPLPDDR